MAKFRAVFLKPEGPFREIPHADTLFGAIANAVSLLYGQSEVDELVNAFLNGARISSAFPFEGDTYYFPKPLSVGALDFEGFLKDLPEEERYIREKAIKKSGYLDLKNFEKALRLEPFDVPKSPPFKRVDVPRVALDRVTENSSLYFWDEVRFKDKAGLYFLYDGPKEVFEEFIKPAVRLLGDTGIGSKATWGSGLFEPSFGHIEIKTPESPHAVTLSNALPSKRPVLWRILRKGGWSFGRRKPKMAFIAEGSIVKGDPGGFEKLDLGLSFQVYVYGRTFPIPTLLPEGLP